MSINNQKVNEVPLPPDELVREFSHFLATQMGLHFPRERWPDLLRSMTSLANEWNFASLELCMRSLMSSSLTKENVERLANYLSVGETYFFREPAVFSALEQVVLPQLIESRRAAGQKQLRIWSAGCCTGEEAYSIAILISRLLPDISSWNITILGTDINSDFLKKAKKGVYRDWSFRNVPAWVKQGYFDISASGSYTIRPSIKRLVTFDYLNLAKDAYPALINNTNAMDLVFCRHVLMYFDQVQVKNVIQKLYRSLIDEGWLVVSSAETNQQNFPQFSTVNFTDTSFYHKINVQETNLKLQLTLNDLPVNEEYENKKHEIETQFFNDEINIPDNIVEKYQELSFTPYQRALTCYEQGTYDQAVTILIENHCGDLPDFILLARIHANQGKLVEAAEFCKLAVNMDKCSTASRYLLAAILAEQDKFDEAIDSLRKAIYLSPDFVLAYFTLGGLYHRQENFIETKKCFSSALELLKKYSLNDILPDSEGMTAGRLIKIIEAKMEFI